MKKYKCDKCGEVVDPIKHRRITVAFGEGPSNNKGHYEYKDKSFPAIIKQDLCIDCWLKYIKKTLKYFNIKNNYSVYGYYK